MKKKTRPKKTTEKKKSDLENKNEEIFFVKGMHCASCEVLVEKELLELESVVSVEASVKKGEVLIEYEKEKPSLETINEIFKDLGYVFTQQKKKEKISAEEKFINIIKAFILVSFVLFGFMILEKTGFTSWVQVDQASSLPAFVFFGLIAGFSSCAALVGGIILSMAKQWGELYAPQSPLKKKLEPHLLFNAGRLLFYGILGAVLGLIGSKIKLSITFSAIMVFLVSLIMIFLAFQMLEFRFFQRFQIKMPKALTRYTADKKHFKGKFMPFFMGGLTFFLPCGFTLTAQSMALLSGNPLKSSLIMVAFALGTLPALLFIGLSSIKMMEKKNYSTLFLKAAGILVLFFAIFNINNQLNVLGVSNIQSLFESVGKGDDSKKIQEDVEKTILKTDAEKKQDENLPPILNGKQVVRMTASAYGYSPRHIKVRVNIPVRWEIEDIGTSGCTNSLIAPSFFNDEIALSHGKTSVKEFTPKNTGYFRFSCWMGMVTGVIEVVE
ncbi:MAG TPA: hypothetical protein DHW82_01540 [Spirochaetia bacterium]|nr:MAG: hypothetical protein A2Y41_06110 [Spirochaetes bacterium GWB1_36_13]HCL55679.1 hypothetical protein [Spirochaetia bacterium]